MNPDESKEWRSAEREMDECLSRYREGVKPVSFRAGFADRVMTRLESARDGTPNLAVVVSISEGLERAFVRLAPLAAAAVVLVAALNVFSTTSSQQPLIDRAIGLPAVSLAAAYTLAADPPNWEDSSR
ncbi:MAG: hypothetical protein ABIT38_04870 [Gemmatimonadaceae bacterium]